MTADLLIRLIIGLVVIWSLWKMVLKPLLNNLLFKKRLRKRLALFGDNFYSIKEPNLTAWENEKLNDYEAIPSEAEILKYYKMYCKKWELDNADVWTTHQPMEFEDFEKNCKTPTQIHKPNGNFGFMVSGGYMYMISKTCDAFVGFPPNQVLMRYRDYERLIEMGTTENA